MAFYFTGITGNKKSFMKKSKAFYYYYYITVTLRLQKKRKKQKQKGKQAKIKKFRCYPSVFLTLYHHSYPQVNNKYSYKVFRYY